MLTEAEIDHIVAAIAKGAHPHRIVVFGSYAKGTATARSDLDLLVVVDTNLPMRRRASHLRPLVVQRLVPVDLHVYTPEEVDAYSRVEFSFLNSVVRFGRVAYERPRAEVAKFEAVK